MAAPKKPLPESPSQTAGPYVHIGCTPIFSGIEGLYPEDPGSRMIDAETRGERITIHGRIFDGDGELVRDAVVEIWQADAAGIHASPEDSRGATDPNFHGWGRVACDFDSGEYRFETVKPGVVPYPDGRLQAPHITFWIVARGINIGLHTRLYFGDEGEANAGDPILSSIEPRARAETLIAAAEEEGCYGFDIYLQGPRETVFLDI
ncbi:MAG TPA: protocatechuate 3,4-dioxygenase subunit alpha [Gammaproteobacteria bacterium]|nr:protocatechuate 3,4-dioxygenase subunit alpha [Gammaproteobacteria bacterium]